MRGRSSIVESESQAADERPRIARVYLNRLQSGMRLQADPTVAYGMGKPPRSRLYYRDLHVNSPFNTYLVSGLPPGPICNPGQASIIAALNPEEGVKDLYFVARVITCSPRPTSSTSRTSAGCGPSCRRRSRCWWGREPKARPLRSIRRG